jgi:hypothetical protein
MAWDQLKTCYDPEIPVNMVDLGLVYSCEVTPAESGGNKIAVRFTLTAPGCGMGDYLKTRRPVQSSRAFRRRRDRRAGRLGARLGPEPHVRRGAAPARAHVRAG